MCYVYTCSTLFNIQRTFFIKQDYIYVIRAVCQGRCEKHIPAQWECFMIHVK